MINNRLTEHKMNRLQLIRILVRPNINIQWYQLDQDDLATLQIWRDNGIFISTTYEESLDQLTLTRTSEFNIVNEYTTSEIYSSPELETTNIKASLYCAENGIIRTHIFWKIVSPDNIVIESGDFFERN
jgi:hypothetical protein